MVLFQVNLGVKDRAEANWILPLICRRGDITRREVGAIRVDRDRTYFEIAAESAASFAANAAEIDPRAPHVVIAAAEKATLPARSFSPPGARSAPPSRGPHASVRRRARVRTQVRVRTPGHPRNPLRDRTPRTARIRTPRKPPAR